MKRNESNVAMLLIVAGLFLAGSDGSNAIAAEFPQGLMLHLSFDPWEPPGSITDRTGRSNNGRATGAKWQQNGKQGAAYEFAASNNFIQVTNSVSLTITQATFAAWFRTSVSDATARYILDKKADGGYAFGITGSARDDKNAGKLFMTINGHECLGDNVLTDGLWHHGTATFDGENLKLYIDGQLQKQVVAYHGEIAANTNNLTIGMNKSNPAPQDKSKAFNGAIDELMVFNHALTEAEVKVVLASMKPKFTKEQVGRRLAELKELMDRGLILQDFYDRKVKECEVTP